MLSKADPLTTARKATRKTLVQAHKRILLFPLSERERLILALIANGLSYKEIAYELGRSWKTIECQANTIRNKLDLHSAVMLTLFAGQEGIA
jgi:DNA-binding NarL/FixJ family response regulator